jgi:antitoxin component of MazEF toxin-antitoxin module
MPVVKVRRWGNSLGVVLPKELVESERIRENENVSIEVKKETSIKDLFGSVRFRKTAQEIKDDARKGWK